MKSQVGKSPTPSTGSDAQASQTSQPPSPRGLKNKLPDVLGQELANIIEKRIVYLELPPGTHVTEQEISNEFDVSRSPVREAFRQLESSGLVVRLARRGIRVNWMTQDDLNEIYSCWIALEGLAAASAAKNATDSDLSEMKSALDGMAAALESGDVSRFFDNNVLFQQLMHNASGNNMLIRILAVMEKHALRYRYFAHARTEEMLTFSLEAQRAVYQAIEARDPQKARRLATNMMKRALRLISRVLKEHKDQLGNSAR
jgi:DNA-binding GntR family transcriptional regulator